ncbi:serine/threonine protein kinase [Cellvibrio mixtus]|uniref:Serine/threonine protein kinase n=1 Tax=Cellvibrio mixtus TaxID=39650 RepID=A0A266Q3S7_9GAMM|nr:serine/threonine-protein kinase [Cellvibrio mixtus]OZY84505.1 serine/threonine protein kinase [Cellvibrio mixtus]
MNIKSAHFLPGTNKRLGDRYILLECLGDGSHGWVWRAERLSDKTVVAVKIPKDLTKDDRVLAEGKELLLIDPHPNIVRICDMGRIPPENEWFFIEMEYFPSQSLAQKLEQRSQNFGNTFERLFAIYEQVLSAVSYLAELPTPISHGDIKPHNILVGAEDLVKLTDFGSSALPEEIYVRTRENGGTVLYAAPEFSDSISRKGTFDDLLRGDIYSLGVLLYQLLTGQLPHDTPSQVRRHAPFKRPSEINSNIVPMVDELILRCMNKAPSDRYQDMESLRSAFDVARKNQLNSPNYIISIASQKVAIDWSSSVVEALEAREYLKAAKLAENEFVRSNDFNALVYQLNAFYRANRLFDFEEVFNREYKSLPTGSDKQTVRLLGIKAFLSLRNTKMAKQLIDDAKVYDGDSLELDFLRATLFGLEANFSEARATLESINRKISSKPQVLIRLVQVCEQMRDYSAAAGYLKHALRMDTNSVELNMKRQRYQELGIW